MTGQVEAAPLVVIGAGLAGINFVKAFRAVNQTQPVLLITDCRGNHYHKPKLSLALQQAVDPKELVMAPATQWAAEYDIECLTRVHVESIDPEKSVLTTSDNRRFTYSDLVIACGSVPKPWTIPGNASDHVIAVNHLMHYERFRRALTGKRRVAIVGSGLVGCEFANDCARAGFEVTVVSTDSYPLQRYVPETLGRAVQSVLAEHGVRWHLASALNRCDVSLHGDVADTFTLTMDDGATIEADVVLSAMGLDANVALAQAAGCAVEAGIVVNDQLQTSVPHIYALGDCAQVQGQCRMYIPPILHGARVLAETLNGGDAAVAYPVLPVGIKTTLCPVAVFAPPADCPGEWVIEGEAPDLVARYLDTAGRLRGFALSGQHAADRAAMAAQVILSD